MALTPIVFKTTHRIRFSDLNLYSHMTTGQYGTTYVTSPGRRCRAV